MKTYKNLFEKITSFENLLLASKRAQRGKRFKESTANFNLNLENKLVNLQDELKSMTYRHGKYKCFWVYDPKRRLISAAPYKDRVVHHALCNVIEPLFDKTFIDDSYACRKGKGSHAAVDRYAQYARKYKYVLKCDLQKYFQSIEHETLLNIISRKIACQETMWLIREIIGSHTDQSFPFYFPGDDLFSPIQRKKGIPIGNLTSQFFANVYLNGFDHFVKEELRVPYIRYVDDFVAFSDSKNDLQEVRLQMTDYLHSLRLKLHERKCRVYQVKEGVCFLGYRVFPTHRLLKKDNVLRMRRKLKKLSLLYRNRQVSLTEINQSVQSWIGHASHADTYKLRSRLFESVVFQRDAVLGSPRWLMEQQ